MARGQSDDIERNASVATRSKSIVSLTAFEGMDEYAALQKYIQFYRDPRSGGHQEQAAPKKKPFWKFWGSSSEKPVAQDASVVPDDVRLLSASSFDGNTMLTCSSVAQLGHPPGYHHPRG